MRLSLRMASSAIRKLVEDAMKDCKNFDRVVDKLKILSIKDGNCTAEMKIHEEHTNPIGGLHGGCSATLVDLVSSWAFASHAKIGAEAPTVSVDIHTSYLKGASVDDEILIDARTIRAGRTMGFVEVDIRNKKTNDLLVKGTHTLYILQGGTFADKK